MKRTLLAITLLTAINANATDLWQQQMPHQTQSQNQSATSSAGNSFNERLQIPATPPAIAPSQSVNTTCQIASPQSSAVSLLIFSVSKTDGVKYNALCFALNNGQFDVAEKMMCEADASYRKANPKCK